MRENFKHLTVRDRTWRKYDMYLIFKYILIVGRERVNFKQLTVRDRTLRKYDMYVIFKYILIVGRERVNDYSGDREKWEFHLK